MPEVFHGSVDGVLSETHSFARPLVALKPTIAVSAQTNAVVPDLASPVSVIFRSGQIYTVDDTKSWAQAGPSPGYDRRGRVGRRNHNAGDARHEGCRFTRSYAHAGLVEGHIHPFMG